MIPPACVHLEMNQLYEQLKNQPSESINEETECCLISGAPLENNHVILKCGHAFNIRPLHQSIYDQINRFHTFSKRALTTAEVDLLHTTRKYEFYKCPYCKTIHFGTPPSMDNLPPIFNHTIFVTLDGKTIQCKAILKTGSNKGKECGCSVILVVRGTYNHLSINYDFSNVPVSFLCGRHTTKTKPKNKKMDNKI